MLHHSTRGGGFSSDQLDVSKGWKKLWGINAPGKMINTLWRFAHDCLPTAHHADDAIFVTVKNAWSTFFSSSMPKRFGKC
jgi:hypothetical protein